EYEYTMDECITQIENRREAILSMLKRGIYNTSGVLNHFSVLDFNIREYLARHLELAADANDAIKTTQPFLDAILKLLLTIDIPPKSSKITVPIEDMRKLERAIQAIPEAQAPGFQLWQAIRPIVTRPQQPGARPLPTQESLALLETFLTTPKSMRELARESNGLWSVAGIRKNLNTSLGRIWQDIPPQDRQGYETAHEAMQAVIASPIKTEEARRKMGIQPGWRVEKPRHHTQNARKKPGEGKREFSDTHTQHLSEGASDRWRRHRAEKSQATTTPEQP
ncbi:MAG TPA: hypothetical protein VEP90_23065, partial [Methylomirabilota bacterium]|nr:hypothetical protein [Methylomirabilota bacterium]